MKTPEGNPISATFIAVFDGMPHRVTGVPHFDAQSVTRVDAYTLIRSFMKAGKLVMVETNVVSPDGKMLTGTAQAPTRTGRSSTMLGSMTSSRSDVRKDFLFR